MVLIDTTPGHEPHDPSKKRAVDGDSELSSKRDNSSPWLTFRGITLMDANKVTIEARPWLNDKYIHFVQTLLLVQFGSISGLKATLGHAQHQQAPYRNSKAI